MKNLPKQVGGNNAPAVFALSPGLNTVNELINYCTKHGAAVYQETKAALPSMFSLKPSKVALFKTKLESRADASGWKSNAQGITKFDNQDNLPVNLI